MAKVGLIGHGVVGSGVAEILTQSKALLSAQVGAPVELTAVCDLRDFSHLPYGELFTKDAGAILDDPTIEVVVECMGGVVPARDFLLRALEAGKHVVTSNKELVVESGAQLLETAKRHGVQFRYEASVGGGIPVVHPLRYCLGANQLTRITGILNGTTNYILTRMRDGGVSFDTALAEAQAAGYAERDPSADVLGWDARRKICILAHVAFGSPLMDSEIATEGITKLTRDDMLYARELGRAVKLLAVAERVEEGWRASVAPAMLPDSHPLANVNDVFNAVLVHGDRVDDVMFYGRGAGKLPTASAVCADILDILRSPTQAVEEPGEAIRALPALDTVTRLFVRADCAPTEEARAAAEAMFPGSRIVCLDGQAFADQFGIITPEGKESSLLREMQTLGQMLPLGVPIRYAAL